MGGVTAMNEPALNMGEVKVGDIFDWLGHAVNIFDGGSLAAKGIAVDLNLIGPAVGQMGAFLNGFPANQQGFIVADIHHYMAWDNSCCGTEPKGTCAYACSDDGAASTVEGCAQKAPGEFPAWPRKAATEFSMGTYNEILDSCRTQSNVLDTMLTSQVTSYIESGVQSFFWTWRMPCGPNFESEWSLKYHLGLETPSSDASLCREPKKKAKLGTPRFLPVGRR